MMQLRLLPTGYRKKKDNWSIKAHTDKIIVSQAIEIQKRTPEKKQEKKPRLLRLKRPPTV